MTPRGIVHVIGQPLGPDAMSSLLVPEHHYDVRLYDSAETFLAQVDPDDTGSVVTDGYLPGMNGLDLLREMKRRDMSLPTVLLCEQADLMFAVAAMKEGAADFLQKPCGDEVLSAFLECSMQQNDLRRHQRAIRHSIKVRLAGLTERERDVLAALLDGHPNKAIARRLGIGTRTVETHRANIMAKMQAASLPELIRMSLEVGINSF